MVSRCACQPINLQHLSLWTPKPIRAIQFNANFPLRQALMSFWMKASDILYSLRLPFYLQPSTSANNKIWASLVKMIVGSSIKAFPTNKYSVLHSVHKLSDNPWHTFELVDAFSI